MENQENIQIPEKAQEEPVDRISKDKVQESISSLRTNFANFVATLPPNSKKILKIALGGVALLLVLLIITSLINGIRTITQKKAPSPSPRAFEAPSLEEITTPSHYAKDAVILKIKDDLGNIDKDLESIDIKETNLALPRIDFNIKFDK